VRRATGVQAGHRCRAIDTDDGSRIHGTAASDRSTIDLRDNDDTFRFEFICQAYGQSTAVMAMTGSTALP